MVPGERPLDLGLLHRALVKVECGDVLTEEEHRELELSWQSQFVPWSPPVDDGEVA